MHRERGFLRILLEPLLLEAVEQLTVWNIENFKIDQHSFDFQLQGLFDARSKVSLCLFQEHFCKCLEYADLAYFDATGKQL
jgi:hypothetical protein